MLRVLLLVILGTVFSLNAFAKERLVVAGGSLTEIVYALGAQDNLVGVDTSSLFPADAHKLPKIGYFRTLNVEGLLSLQPTQVLLLEGSGPSSVIQQLDALGLNTTLVKNPKTVEGLITTIRTVAEKTGTQEAGEALIKQVNNKLSSLSDLPKLKDKSAVLLMSAGERGLVAAGQNTTPQLIFDELNLTNPFANLHGFKPVSEEALAQTPPDIILIASHTTRGKDVETLCASSQLKLWASINGCNLVKIDSLKFLGLTPRLPNAIEETRQLVNNL